MWKASLLSNMVERLYHITALETLRYVFYMDLLHW